MTTSEIFDRAAGAVVGMAAGDALGAGYEFGQPLSDDTVVTMKGGGAFGWEPGEWTDDTSMAVPILRAIAHGKDLLDETVQDEIVAAWVEWAKTAPDVGVQLSQILKSTEPSAAAVRAVAKAHHELNGRSAGNGSLMRTAPVALAFLDDPDGLTIAARAISDLTHFEQDAGDACVIWSHAIRHAILTGELLLSVETLPEDRQQLWADRIAIAEQSQPHDFTKNGWVVEALQGAWSAIVGAEATDASRLRESLENAVRGGRDTDTVAAIAGGLIGAVHGVSAVPAEWLEVIHGWPGLRAADLQRLALQVVAEDPAASGLDY